MVEYEVLSRIGAPIGPATSNTRDTFVGGASPNDFSRIFTWSWGGHGGLQGFSYGLSVTNGANNGTSYLWEANDENHPLPYTEVYIRGTAGEGPRHPTYSFSLPV